MALTGTNSSDVTDKYISIPVAPLAGVYISTLSNVPFSIIWSRWSLSFAGRVPAWMRTPSSTLSFMPALVRLALVIRTRDLSAITHLA